MTNDRLDAGTDMREKNEAQRPEEVRDGGEHLLSQLVAHLREHRTRLREEWAERIQQAHLLTAMTSQEMAAETTSVYDNYIKALETGSVEALQHYARLVRADHPARRRDPRGRRHRAPAARRARPISLFEKYQRDFGRLNEVLDAYEPAANRIANTVAVSFVDERERPSASSRTDGAIRELSTPVLPVRERLLILPIIGVLDSDRAKQLTEQLLTGIRRHRIGVDLSKMKTIGDLQGGLEEAEHLLGYTLTKKENATSLVNSGPALVWILRQGSTLIASVHTALDDSQLVRFQNDLIGQIGEHRSFGIIIGVAALDVIDSFAALTLRTIAETAPARSADGDRRHPARGGLHNGAAWHGHRQRPDSTGPLGGLQLLSEHAGGTQSPSPSSREGRRT